jgi:dCMP deaminase
MQTNLTKWDHRFMALAKFLSSFSKDPTTKVGCVIADHRNRIVGTGFNGFAAGIKDTDKRLNDRELKLLLTIHAEKNALAFATRDVEGCTAYVWPLPPCSPCAAAMIQQGIRRVVAPNLTEKHSQWLQDYTLANEMYQEKGVITDFESLSEPSESRVPEGELGAYYFLAEAERHFRDISKKGVTISHRQLGTRADTLAELLVRWSL